MRLLFVFITFIFSTQVNASNAFSCTIKDLTSSNSHSDTLIVDMNCSTGDPVPDGTDGCTSGSISQTSFGFDTTTGNGKTNLALVMMAFASGKQIYASHYHACTANSSSTPLLYTLKVFGG